MIKLKKLMLPLFSVLFCGALALTPCLVQAADSGDAEKEVTIRVCNWEEYIDLGDWDEDETIDLPDGDIIGINSMVDDFEEWYEETYGIRCHVEYSTFGTNEDLYNMLTLGDVYDLVCPSEYMIMKLMAEQQLVPLSDDFFDTSDENNYYTRGVSPYIQSVLTDSKIEGESWSKYMAGYMWGVTGIVYNPEKVTEEEASTWKIINNPKFRRQITVKDNVRDTYFAAVGAVKSDLLCSEEFKNDPDYKTNLLNEMNDTSDATRKTVLDYLQDVKDNSYSFETDSGKADMVTGKVVANLQWSGDAVYTMDQAAEDDFDLCFAVPEESTDIYFDGWVMLKNGVGEDADKRQACEAFINFLSRPDNAIRNMYYIGYTSCIAGGDDDRIFEYLDWNYGAEEDEEDTVDYPVGYFFCNDNTNEKYVIQASKDQLKRQLFTQYPSAEAIQRSCIMIYFDQDVSTKINEMWIHVRCFNILDVPKAVWVVLAVGIILAAALLIRYRRNKKRI